MIRGYLSLCRALSWFFDFSPGLFLNFEVADNTARSSTTLNIIDGPISSHIGDAANLRFMPECLCYIYHHMAFELYGMLDGNVSPMTGENVKAAYG
ncbi:putative 1,3-beta-glucan synthase [Helianthus anomalus]